MGLSLPEKSSHFRLRSYSLSSNGQRWYNYPPPPHAQHTKRPVATESLRTPTPLLCPVRGNVSVKGKLGERKIVFVFLSKIYRLEAGILKKFRSPLGERNRTEMIIWKLCNPAWNAVLTKMLVNCESSLDNQLEFQRGILGTLSDSQLGSEL